MLAMHAQAQFNSSWCVCLLPLFGLQEERHTAKDRFSQCTTAADVPYSGLAQVRHTSTKAIISTLSAQHSASILAQIAWILYQAALVILLAVVLFGAEHLNTRLSCCCSAYCCASPCARSKNEHVVVNFGGSPFKFDLEGLLAEEREQQAAAVQR
jgi:hypothetical protein